MELSPLHMPAAKRCLKCLVLKDRDEFGIDNGRPDRKSTRCFACKRQESADYFAAHPEQCRAATAKWQAENPEKISAYTASYAPKKHEKYLVRYADNKDEIQKQQAGYYATHKEFLAPKRAKYNKEHLPELRAKAAERYRANPEKELQRHRDYRARHPGYATAQWERRRSREAGAEKYDLSPAQFAEICRARQYRCAYCKPDCKACKNKTHKLHQEHVEPAIKGGSYTVQNIVPSCASCNASKGARPVPVPVQLELITEAPPRKPRKDRRKKSEEAAD